ncbi:MAG: hypothetical protein ACYTAF_10510, partial [Planctomycetota bacterium]
LKEKIGAYQEALDRFPEPGGDNLLRDLRSRNIELPFTVELERMRDLWGKRIEWIRVAKDRYLLYSHGPDGVDNGGEEDDISVEVKVPR